MNSTQIIPMSAIRSCPIFSWSPTHWNHFDEDGKCNCGRLCGYTDEFGGPCILKTDYHPHLKDGTLRHDDGKRIKNTSVWVR